MNKKNVRFTSAVLSLALATGIALTPTSVAFAEKKPKQGTFIEYTINENGMLYNRYVVKQGDNVSRISEKICKFFGQEKETKYWPAIAYLNGFPNKTLRPGDIIIFPETFEELVILNASLKATGWTANYIQKNGIYKEKEEQYSSLVELIEEAYEEMYGKPVKVDSDLVYRYLDAIGLANKYDAASGMFTNNELFELTDWVPTLDDLGYEPEEMLKNSK